MNYINLYRFIENSTKIDFVTPHRVSFARINKIMGYIKSITLPFCPLKGYYNILDISFTRDCWGVVSLTLD